MLIIMLNIKLLVFIWCTNALKAFKLSEELLHKGVHLQPVIDFASFYESFLT